jgi:hypothetical protein
MPALVGVRVGIQRLQLGFCIEAVVTAVAAETRPRIQISEIERRRDDVLGQLNAAEGPPLRIMAQPQPAGVSVDR